MINIKIEIRNRKQEIRNKKQEIRNWKLEIKNELKAEILDAKIRDWRFSQMNLL